MKNPAAQPNRRVFLDTLVKGIIGTSPIVSLLSCSHTGRHSQVGTAQERQELYNYLIKGDFTEEDLSFLNEYATDHGYKNFQEIPRKEYLGVIDELIEISHALEKLDFNPY